MPRKTRTASKAVRPAGGIRADFRTQIRGTIRANKTKDIYHHHHHHYRRRHSGVSLSSVSTVSLSAPILQSASLGGFVVYTRSFVRSFVLLPKRRGATSSAQILMQKQEENKNAQPTNERAQSLGTLQRYYKVNLFRSDVFSANLYVTAFSSAGALVCRVQ